MIKLINGVAYLKDIKNQDQSMEMFKYLQENIDQKLYLIEGVNKYGCGENGELIRLEQMPSSLIENGYCINPFYIEEVEVDENEPAIEPTTGELVSAIESLSDVFSGDFNAMEVAEQHNEYEDKYNEVKTALENAIKERDIYVAVKEGLDNEITSLRIANKELANKWLDEKERADAAEKKLANINIDDNKVSRTDAYELFKALYDLGFVNLGFVGNKNYN